MVDSSLEFWLTSGRYTVEFENVDAAMAESIMTGDTARGAGGIGKMGEVVVVKTSVQTAYVYDPETQSMVAREFPSPDGTKSAPVTLRITIRTDAMYKSGSGYTVGGHRISVGSPLSISFDGFSGNGNCIAIYGVN